jgi:hypothetical protein
MRPMSAFSVPSLLAAVAMGLLVVGQPAVARAAGNDLVVQGLVQDQFRDLVTELGVALSAVQAQPAESLGLFLAVPHFDVGAESTLVNINQDRPYWRLATHDGSAPSLLPLPKLHANVGLPFGFEVGGLYSSIPDSNIRLLGAEAKWAVVKGGVLWPAVAVRGAYTALGGVEELDLTTTSVDLSVSKGFAFVTPYLGAGRVWIDAEPKGAAAATPVNLKAVSSVEDRLFAGVRLRLAFLSAVAETTWARVPAYTLRFNVSF